MYDQDRPPVQYGDSHSREFIPAAVMQQMFPVAEKDTPSVPTPEYFTD